MVQQYATSDIVSWRELYSVLVMVNSVIQYTHVFCGCRFSTTTTYTNPTAVQVANNPSSINPSAYMYLYLMMMYRL